MDFLNLLFVYGTLRRGLGGTSRAALERHARWEGRGRLAGRLFMAEGYPAAVAAPAGSQWVVGDLYRVWRPASLFAVLDRYEDAHLSGPADRPSDRATDRPPDRPALGEYRRERHRIAAEDGSRRLAWVYLDNGSVEGLTPIASGDFLHCDLPM
ncbi:MAG: gamma-glutamylcyclotransferase, partial [SAR324 cluster bacterium]|nr:gamma-glutamylcyclotransferase [SAR324 cluster bacterium]